MSPDVFDHEIPTSQLFKIIWTGYFWGGATLIVPVMLLLPPIMMFTEGIFEGVSALLLVVVAATAILAGQGLLIGGMVLFGLAVYRRILDARRTPAP